MFQLLLVGHYSRVNEDQMLNPDPVESGTFSCIWIWIYIICTPEKSED